MKNPFTPLFSATAETQGNATAAKPAARPAVAPQPIGISAAELVADIESNPADFTDVTLPEDGPTKAAEVKKGKGEGENTQAAKAEAGSQKPEVSAAKPAELTADQTAWLELRAAAKTAEEAATLEKDAPEFTDEQWALVEKSEDGSQKTEDGTPSAEVTAQLTAAQTEATTAKAELETVSKRLQAVEAELAQAKTQPVSVAPMHPLLAASPEDVTKAESNAIALKEWALKNWDGAPAAGDQPAYTAEQVRGAYARADKQLSSVIPAAREYQKIYEQENAVARQVYPALFDPNSPHAQTRASILQRLPGLKAGLPQISTVMGDAIVGETLRGVLLAQTPSADVLALRSALVKAVPSLTTLMPALNPAASARKSFRLPAKPIVPLARPGSTAGHRSAPRAANSKPAGGAPSVKKFLDLKAANGGNELEALTESLRNVNVD